MKGDYHRYLAEFKTGGERKEAAEQTLLAYKAAQDIALVDLPPTHPIRLGLALNFRCPTTALPPALPPSFSHLLITLLIPRSSPPRQSVLLRNP